MGTDARKYSSAGHDKGGGCFKISYCNDVKNFGYLIPDLQDFDNRLLSNFVVVQSWGNCCMMKK